MKFYNKAKETGSLFSSLFNQSRNLRKKYLPASSADELINRHYTPTSSKTLSLDLGCGRNPRNPFQATKSLGVDIRGDLEGDISQADLSIESIPFSDNTFDFCTAFDFLEHIPKSSYPQGKQRFAFLELMNEIYRVLKPGGMFLHSTPAFPSKQAFQDPTHVNIITEDTMPKYFCEPKNWAKYIGYGFNGNFELIEQRWVRHIWVTGIMRALK